MEEYANISGFLAMANNVIGRVSPNAPSATPVTELSLVPPTDRTHLSLPARLLQALHSSASAIDEQHLAALASEYEQKGCLPVHAEQLAALLLPHL